MAALSPERWDALRVYLDSALSLDDGARESYLQSLTASDPGLVAELRALIEEYGHLGDFLEGNATQPATVGPYRVIGTLGEGGMGTVYLAEQLEPVRRTIALKVIRLLGGRHLIARFESERQALAMMEHPNIARLYDAGITAEGHPYFAMEYVDGVPVTKYCDEHKLSIRERLRLFQQICGAVQHAHQKGVIHRDIKPSNVLVMLQDGAPVPKVIDFGVAKAVNTRLTDRTLQTEAGVRVGTPRYMSPEQELGADIDTTTDIYSLGVLLYELLIGVTPRDSTAPGDDVLSPATRFRRIKNSEIAANRGVSVDGLLRLLKGDIEWITLKALEHDRSRRYASASEFTADVGRYLEDEVILARAPGLWLSLRKFVRRNRLASAVALAVLAGFAATSIAATVAIRERSTAQQRAIEMRQLAGRLIFELHGEIDTLPGATKAVEKLAAISSEYLQRLEGGGNVDPDLAFELATAYSRLSSARGSPGRATGDSKSAIDYSHRTLKFGQIAESKPGVDDDKLRQLFRAYVLATDVFREAGLRKDEWATIEHLFAVVPRLGLPGRVSAEAVSHRLAGIYYDKFESPEKAVAELKKSLDLYRLEPERPERIAAALSTLARTLGRVGDLDGALTCFEEAVKTAERVVAAEPSNVLFTRNLYLDRMWLGDLLGAPDRLNLGRAEAAAAHYDKAIRIAEQLVASDPKNERAKLDLASASGKLGSLIASAQPARALALMDRSAEMARATSFGNRSGMQMRLVYLTESVTPLVAMGRLDQAKRHTEEARQLQNTLPEAGQGDSEVRVLRKEAEWLHRSGRAKEAFEAGLRVRDLLDKATNLQSFSEGYQWILALEALQKYARNVDPAICRDAANKAAQYWDTMLLRYPASSVIRSRTMEARVRAQDPALCSK
jgi:tetratricopeptide (TPR) repeat protein